MSLPNSITLHCLPGPSLKSLPLLRLCLFHSGQMIPPFLLHSHSLLLQSVPLSLLRQSQGELILYATLATKSSTFHYVVHVHSELPSTLFSSVISPLDSLLPFNCILPSTSLTIIFVQPTLLSTFHSIQLLLCLTVSLLGFY